MSDKTCISPLATRPVLYTDTVGGKQTCRDDLWAVTTDELNELHRQAAPEAPDSEQQADDFVSTLEGAAKEATDEWIAGFVRQHFGIYTATVDAQADTQQAGGMDYAAVNAASARRAAEYVALNRKLGEMNSQSADTQQAHDWCKCGDDRKPAAYHGTDGCWLNATPAATTASCGNSHQSPYLDAVAPSAGVGKSLVDAATTASASNHAIADRLSLWLSASLDDHLRQDEYRKHIRAWLEFDGNGDSLRAPAQQTERMQPSREAVPVGPALREMTRAVVERLGWTINGTWVITKSGDQIHTADAIAFVHAALAQQGAAQAGDKE